MRPLSDYRSEFPVTKSYIYLDHASVAPLPRRVATAMQDLAEDVTQNGAVHYADWMATLEALRQSSARLIGASPDEIAITKNTSEGLAIVANGIDWHPGDVVAGVQGEFPANYFPWLQLERQGVELRWIEQRRGRIDLDDIDRACKGARLLAISFVQYLSGFRLDLDAVGEICRRRNCLLVVDAVQGLGPFPVDVKKSGIHALSAGGHKWLLGPEGCGICFIDRELIPHVRPVEFGWTNVAGWRGYSLDPELAPGAARYECGTLNTIGCHGLLPAIELFLEAGVGRIAGSIHSLAGQIVEGATAKGYEIMTPRDEHTGSGIVCIRKQGLDAKAIVQQLAEKNVILAPRFGWVRASPHFYANEDDIARFLELLP